MGFGLGGRSELDVATSVWGDALFVGPMEGSIGSFGRCGVSSSVRIMLLDQLQGVGSCRRRQYSIKVLHLVLIGIYVVRSRW